MTPAVTASKVPPTRPDLNALGLIAAVALGISAAVGAVSIVLTMLCGG